MGMSEAYVNASMHVLALLVNKIVHDRFQVMPMATKGMDEVRRGEHRLVMTHGDDSLSKAKYVWLTSFNNLAQKRQAPFQAA